MAVHVPLSLEAQTESWMLMLAAKNLLDTASGNPIVGPSQDMILGVNYLTRIQKDVKGQGRVFKDFNEVLIAAELEAIHLQAGIKVRVDSSFKGYNFKPENNYIETSAGRVIFNDYLPSEVEFINEPLNDKAVNKIMPILIKPKEQV